MRIYYEATEINADKTVEPDFARADVTDLSEADRAQVLAELKIIVPDGVYRRHICRHEEGAACDMTEVPE
jgi:hypothetical protein